jgi:hypothetical protein
MPARGPAVAIAFLLGAGAMLVMAWLVEVMQPTAAFRQCQAQLTACLAACETPGV